MEVKIKSHGLDDKNYFQHAEEMALFFSVMKNPALHTVQEVNKAKDWLISLVVVSDGEKERVYKNKVKKVIGGYSFTEIIELVSSPIEPDPKESGNSEED